MIVFKLSNLLDVGWDVKRLADAVILNSPLLFGAGKWVVRVTGSHNESGKRIHSQMVVCQHKEDLAKFIEPLWDLFCRNGKNPDVSNVALEINFISEMNIPSKDDYARALILVVDDRSDKDIAYYENSPSCTVKTIHKD